MIVLEKNKMIDKDCIEKKLLLMLQTEFQIDISMSNLKDENVFGIKIGILPRDYLNLINLIEEKFMICIAGEDIEKYRLQTITQIVNLIYDKLRNNE